MIYQNYILQSLHVFTLSFVLGVVIDNTFKKILQTYPDKSLYLAFLQLFTVISVSYILHEYHFRYSETYTPHVLFSSFLLSLQTTMIQNFRIFLQRI
jgi:hypothetical protein